MINFFANIIMVIVLGITQVSFLTTWPSPVKNLNLIVSLIIFLIVLGHYRRSLWWAFGGGLFLELYSPYFFGLIMINLILTIIIINFLFKNFFTDYSLYSLTVLGLAGTLIYNFFFIFSNLLVSFLNFSSWPITLDFYFLSYLIWQIVLNLLILYILFFIFHFLIGKFKMNFSKQISDYL